MDQPNDDTAFEDLIRYIQESRGIDFRGYKRTSLRRRILLRMEHLRIDSFADYHGFLEVHPQEFVELLNTVLINVTSFFRDPDAWDVLKTTVLPELIAPERGPRPVACVERGMRLGTGTLFSRHAVLRAAGPAEFARRVKIYATDLDEAALTSARQASYSPQEVEGVPPPLLEKYFERTNDHYLVSRDLRKGRHLRAAQHRARRADLARRSVNLPQPAHLPGDGNPKLRAAAAALRSGG